MVSIQEALQQQEQAEETATQREKQIARAETRARRIRVGGTVAEQLRFGSALPQARQQARQQRAQALEQLGVAREELGEFRGAVAGRQEQIASAQRQAQAAADFNRDLAAAQKFAARGSVPMGESGRVRKLFRQLTGSRGTVVRRQEQDFIALPPGTIGSAPDGQFLFQESGGGIIVGRAVASAVGGGVLIDRVAIPKEIELAGGFSAVPSFQKIPSQVSLPIGDVDTRTSSDRGLPGFGSATFESIKIVGRDIGRAFRGKGEFENPLDPFRGRGTARGDRPFTQRISLIPESELAPKSLRRGILPELLTSQEFGTGETRREAKQRTELEVGISPELIGLTPTARRSRVLEKAEQEVRSQLKGDLDRDVAQLGGQLQERVDIGSLSLSDAQRQFEEGIEPIRRRREEEFQTSFRELSTERLGELGEKERQVSEERQFSNLGVTSGTRFAEIAPRVLETGALVGASFTPVGATIAGGLLLGTSAKDFGRGILGTSLTPSERALSLGTGALEAGIGGVFIRSALGPQRTVLSGLEGERVSIPSNLLERQFQREQLRELKRLPVNLVSATPPKVGAEFTTTRFVGSRGVSGIREELDVILKSFPSGVVKGRGISDISLRSVFGERISLPSQQFKVGTKFPPTVVRAPVTKLGEGISITGEELGTGAFGVGTIRFGGQQSFREFGFLGVSQKGPSGIQGIGGRQRLVKIPKRKEPLVQGFNQEIRPDVVLDLPSSIRGTKEVFTFIPQQRQVAGTGIRVIQPRGGGPGTTDIFGRLDTSVRLGNVEKVLRQQSKSLETFGAPETGLLGNIPQQTVRQSERIVSTVTAPSEWVTISPVIIPTQGEFAGTGQFERTGGGLTPPGQRQISIQAPVLTGRTRQPNQFISLSTRQPNQFINLSLDGGLQDVGEGGRVGGINITNVLGRARQGLVQAQPTRLASAQLQPLRVRLDQDLQLRSQQFLSQSLVSPGLRPTSRFGSIRGFAFRGFAFPFTPTLGGMVRRKRRSPGRKKRRTEISPSFTASALELTGPLPQATVIGGVDIGILPGRIRRVPKKKGKKRTKSIKKKVKKKRT